jgi:hypothetical protein
MHKLSVLITGKADIFIKNIDTNETISSYVDTIVEYWHFKKEGRLWKLDLITQYKGGLNKIQKKVADFAKKHKYYFDTQYALFSLPNACSIKFNETNVTNYVLGLHNDIAFEICTINSKYLIVQIHMNTPCDHVIVRRNIVFKNKPDNLELAEIDNWKIAQKYSVYMEPDSPASELSILNSQFLKKFEVLPKDFTVEIMNNVVFCYTKGFRNISYQNILEMTKALIEELP